MGIRYYWEDLQPGSVLELGSVTVTADEIKQFAAQFDPQPFHLEEEAGRRSIFGNLCASGWHTCALAMKLSVENFLSQTVSKGSPGVDSLRWFKPVYPGDTLTLQHAILDARPMRTRPGTGLAQVRWEMFNQHREKVMQMEGWGMFGRREAATPEEIARMDAARQGSVAISNNDNPGHD